MAPKKKTTKLLHTKKKVVAKRMVQKGKSLKEAKIVSRKMVGLMDNKKKKVTTATITTTITKKQKLEPRKTTKKMIDLPKSITAEKIEQFNNNTLEDLTFEQIRKLDPNMLPNLHQRLLAKFADPDHAFVLAIKANSLGTYLANKQAVVSRRSYRTGVNFPYTVDGVIDFLLDPLVIEEIANSTATYYVSAFKFLYRLDHKVTLPEKQSSRLAQALQTRHHVVPDSSRVTGAVNRERLMQFLTWLDKQQNLKTEDAQLFKDVATMCYSGALRINQCISLKKSSFELDKKRSYTWISILRKGQGVKRENKILDPKTIDQAMEIVRRRSNDFKSDEDLFKDWKKSKQIKFGELLKQASIELDWPAGHHFQGTHMLRHGAIQDAVKEGGLKFGKLRSGHESDACLELYARTDVERTMRIDQENEENTDREKETKALLDGLQKMYEIRQANKDAGDLEIQPMEYDFAETAKRARDSNSQALLRILEKRTSVDQNYTDEEAPPNWSDTVEIERKFTFFTAALRASTDERILKMERKLDLLVQAVAQNQGLPISSHQVFNQPTRMTRFMRHRQHMRSVTRKPRLSLEEIRTQQQIKQQQQIQQKQIRMQQQLQQKQLLQKQKADRIKELREQKFQRFLRSFSR